MSEEMTKAVAAESDADKLNRLAAEINIIKEQTRAVMQNATLEIGKRLKQAKATVGHGNWKQWLEENVDYKERTAQNIIAIYERFSSNQEKLFGRSANQEQIAKLSRSQMLALMSIKDEEECFGFMEEHSEDLHDMSKRELEKAIKEMKAMKAAKEESDNRAIESHEKLQQAQSEIASLKEELANAEMSPEARRQKEELEAELERLKKSYDMSKRQAEERDRYKKLFEDAQAHANAQQAQQDAQIDKLKTELNAVKNQPIETVTVEKVPEEMLAEMEQLKAKLQQLEETKAKRELTKAEKQFARHYENIRQEGDAMLVKLREIDEGIRDKYKAIAVKMLSRLAELVQ